MRRRGGADRNDPPAVRSRAVQRLGRRGVERAPFAVHDVGLGVLRFHGQEGPRPDVQRDPMQRHAARAHAVDQPGREMKPGGRRGDRAGALGEQGLIVGAILSSGARRAAM